MKRWFKRLFLIVILLALLAIVAVYMLLRASLPQYAGNAQLVGLADTVKVERDQYGVASVFASNRLDAARATGYIHAQERYFQMDLMRRQVSGRLSELFGPIAVDLDHQMRRHDFSRHAQNALAMMPKAQADLLYAYVEGVNAGLAELTVKPFEYLLLNQQPTPWQAQDSVAVIYAMALDLTKEEAKAEQLASLLRQQLPAAVADYILATGSRWDAPLAGDVYQQPPVPDASVWRMSMLGSQQVSASMGQDAPLLGSNNWAISAARSLHGGAIVADDMHLTLRVPNIWYRLQLNYADDQGQHQITGVSLAGAPLIVAGSNGKVAWGFTNSYGDWVDLIQLQYADASKSSYHTANGPQKFSKRQVLVRDSKGEQHVREQLDSIYGPILKHDPQGNPLAVRWTQYYPQAANLNLMHMEQAQDVNEAVAIGNISGIPPQNLMLADKHGNIAWTIAGIMPVRHYDGSQLVPWQLAGDGFSDWLAPQDYPRVYNPASGQLQTANARVASGADLLKLGDGGYDLGIRQRQIRDHLATFAKANEQDMLTVQLDDEAQFYGEWYQLLRQHLHTSADAEAANLLKVLQDWDGHASINSIAYSLVREYRLQVRDRVWAPLEDMVKQQDEDLSLRDWRQLDGPLWQLIHEQPMHWLNPAFDSWQELYDEAANAAYQALLTDAESTGNANWGSINQARIQHPLSRAVPQLSWFLDMPTDMQSGDSFLPKVAGNTNGASERFAVSPGKESQGYFHMPGGQSGHPLSPYYGAGHEAWQQGIPTPFLPSAVQQSLILEK